MKKILFVVVTVLFFSVSHAQIMQARLQANGLTCALCSNAINKALQKLPFIASVHSNIKESSFDMVFKENADVDIDAIRDAVSNAGFSVGKLQLTAHFENARVSNESHLKIGKEQFHFIDVSSQVLNGDKVITVIDRNFVPAKDFKKYSSDSKMKCVHTGRADDCCLKAGLSAGERVYHVTI